MCRCFQQILTNAVYKTRFCPAELSSGGTALSEPSAHRKTSQYVSVRLGNCSFLFLFPHRHPCHGHPSHSSLVYTYLFPLWGQEDKIDEAGQIVYHLWWERPLWSEHVCHFVCETNSRCTETVMCRLCHLAAVFLCSVYGSGQMFPLRVWQPANLSANTVDPWWHACSQDVADDLKCALLDVFI